MLNSRLLSIKATDSDLHRELIAGNTWSGWCILHLDHMTSLFQSEAWVCQCPAWVPLIRRCPRRPCAAPPQNNRKTSLRCTPHISHLDTVSIFSNSSANNIHPKIIHQSFLLKKKHILYYFSMNVVQKFKKEQMRLKTNKESHIYAKK